VNPIVSSKYLAETLNSYGVHSIAVYTLNFEIMSDYYKPKAGYFSTELYLPNATVDEILAELSGFKIDYVVNGVESSLVLSDQIANKLTPQYANDVTTTDNRCNKYHMHKCLEANNLECIQQMIITKDNYSQYQYNFPAFIKPLFGAGSIGAMKLNALPELDNYFKNQLTGVMAMPEVFEQGSGEDFLFAEFVDGEEYLVDSFSINGVHHIASIQKYNKKLIDGLPIYVSWDVILDRQISHKVNSYINEVLTATGFNNGFAHTELFLTKDNVVKLIEINPRISGASGLAHRLARLNGLPSQIDLMAQYVFNLPVLSNSSLYKFSRVVILFNKGGHVMPNLQDKLVNIAGIEYIHQIIAPGDYSAIDVKNLTDAAGMIIVGGNTEKELEDVSKQVLDLDYNNWR